MSKKTLDFDESYIRKILEGKKVTTIRKGIRDFKIGDRVLITSQNRIYAEAEITGVKYTRISELTEEDAVRDGFLTKEELLKALKKYYGQIKTNDAITIIHFKLLKKFSDY